MIPEHELVKERLILFQNPHPDSDQAARAATILAELEGILLTEPLDRVRLRVRYDLRRLSFVLIEGALIDIGFHLDGTLLSKLRRALYEYSEELIREGCGCLDQQESTMALFVQQYRLAQHGCRDDRPEHWRRYL